MSSPSLSQEENLFDFFHQAVGCAVDSTRTTVSEDGVYYLSNLLVERGRTSEVPQPETLGGAADSARASTVVLQLYSHGENSAIGLCTPLVFSTEPEPPKCQP